MRIFKAVAIFFLLFVASFSSVTSFEQHQLTGKHRAKENATLFALSSACGDYPPVHFAQNSHFNVAREIVSAVRSVQCTAMCVFVVHSLEFYLCSFRDHTLYFASSYMSEGEEKIDG